MALAFQNYKEQNTDSLSEKKSSSLVLDGEIANLKAGTEEKDLKLAKIRRQPKMRVSKNKSSFEID